MLEENEKDEKIIEFLENYQYSETLNTFFSLRKDCIGIIDPPIVLEHQILGNDGNRLPIQDLEMLVKDGELRKLKVPRSLSFKNITSSIGYSLKSDILRILKQRIQEKYSNLEGQNRLNGCFLECLFNNENNNILLQNILNLIKENIFQNYKTISINNKHLLDYLSLICIQWKSQYNICQSHQTNFNGDFLLNLLIKFGILRSDASDLHSLIFTTPSMGLFIQYLESGNTVIINSLKRSKYKELFEDKFNTLKLGKSLLPLDFHLRDLHGTGIIKRMVVHNNPIKVCKLCNIIANRRIQKKRTIT
ncbi:Serine-threonine protein kinase 19 [Cryptosporidium tyzzeri]|nr:Serine-threonine protein kinase 19 [Cryptosporidium tyzzeri]